MRLVVLLPALNEVEAIGKVIEEIPRKELQTMGFKVDTLIADSGSNDGTVDLALESGCSVVHGRRGKGNTIRYALKFLKEVDYVCMIDSDHTYKARNIPLALTVMITYNLDVLYGFREPVLMEEGAMPLTNLIGNRILTRLADTLYGKEIFDLCTGFWVFNRKALNEIRLTAKNFELEADIFIELNKRNLRFSGFPIVYGRRLGTPPKLKISDGLLIAWKLIEGKIRR